MNSRAFGPTAQAARQVATASGIDATAQAAVLASGSCDKSIGGADAPGTPLTERTVGGRPFAPTRIGVHASQRRGHAMGYVEPLTPGTRPVHAGKFARLEELCACLLLVLTVLQVTSELPLRVALMAFSWLSGGTQP